MCLYIQIVVTSQQRNVSCNLSYFFFLGKCGLTWAAILTSISIVLNSLMHVLSLSIYYLADKSQVCKINIAFVILENVQLDCSIAYLFKILFFSHFCKFCEENRNCSGIWLIIKGRHFSLFQKLFLSVRFLIPYVIPSVQVVIQKRVDYLLKMCFNKFKKGDTYFKNTRVSDQPLILPLTLM